MLGRGEQQHIPKRSDHTGSGASSFCRGLYSPDKSQNSTSHEIIHSDSRLSWPKAVQQAIKHMATTHRTTE